MILQDGIRPTILRKNNVKYYLAFSGVGTGVRKCPDWDLDLKPENSQYAYSVPKCALLSPADAILRQHFAHINHLRALLSSVCAILSLY